MEKINDISFKVIGAAFKVHKNLGPGLLESSYEICMMYELSKLGLRVENQKALPVVYKDIRLNAGYRVDLIVENKLLVEIKSVEVIAPIHTAQILTYLKLSGITLGLLMNFNVDNMQKGIKRVIL